MMNKEKVIDNYRGLINSICYSYVHSITMEFEDLRQEAITHLWKKLDKYDAKKAKMTTFIFIVTRNHFLNMSNSPRNNRDIPIDFKDDDIIDNSDYSTFEKDVIAEGYEVLRSWEDYEEKKIIEELLSGRKQKDVALDYDVSRQKISLIWVKYINKTKERI